MDLSSELIHSLLPVFLVTSLGAGTLTIGFIEGIAEATSLIVKVFSGAISDFFGRRKILLLLGYGMAALTKPLFPLADSVVTVFIARFLDRIGKGIRGAPRDALIADIAPANIRGACFGLRQSMDTIGAFLAPLLAILLLFLFNNNLTPVLWLAVVPAVIAVLLIVVSVNEPEGEIESRSFQSPLNWALLSRFSSQYWWVVTIGGFFTLARFSEAFLLLRGHQAGLSIAWIPSVMVVMNLTYALSSYPVGIISDGMDKKGLLIVGLLLLILADLMLARAESISVLMSGIALWGLHMGFSQGILTTMVAETTPPDLKGTAYGLFNLISGLFMFSASLVAGFLWESYGSDLTFYCSAALSFLALSLLLIKPSYRVVTRPPD